MRNKENLWKAQTNALSFIFRPSLSLTTLTMRSNSWGLSVIKNTLVWLSIIYHSHCSFLWINIICRYSSLTCKQVRCLTSQGAKKVSYGQFFKGKLWLACTSPIFLLHVTQPKNFQWCTGLITVLLLPIWQVKVRIYYPWAIGHDFLCFTWDETKANDWQQ